MIELTREDWTEIFYALVSKRRYIAEYNQVKTEQKRWAAELDNIMAQIGPDGEHAADYGVSPVEGGR